MDDIFKIIGQLAIAALVIFGAVWLYRIIKNLKKSVTDTETCSFFVVDADKAGDKIEFIIRDIQQKICAGKLGFICRIILCADSPSENESVKICEILSAKYENIIIMEKKQLAHLFSTPELEQQT